LNSLWRNDSICLLQIKIPLQSAIAGTDAWDINWPEAKTLNAFYLQSDYILNICSYNYAVVIMSAYIHAYIYTCAHACMRMGINVHIAFVHFMGGLRYARGHLIKNSLHIPHYTINSTVIYSHLATWFPVSDKRHYKQNIYNNVLKLTIAHSGTKEPGSKSAANIP